MFTHAELLERLEELVDGSSMVNVLSALSDMCLQKEEHIRTNWGDGALVRAWQHVHSKLDVATNKASGLQDATCTGNGCPTLGGTAMDQVVISKLKRMLRRLDDYQLANEYAELLTTHAEEFSRAARYLAGGASFTAEWFRGRITTGWESICIYRGEIDRRRQERGL